MNLSEPLIKSLIHRCSSSKHCALLEFHTAATKVFEKLEAELRGNPPLGPDPLPDLDDELQFLLDSDGAGGLGAGFCSEREGPEASPNKIL